MPTAESCRKYVLLRIIVFIDMKHNENTTFALRLMPQSHPTTGSIRFLSTVRFVARKTEWSTRRKFTSVLFAWSPQATGPVWLDTSAHLWFEWIIRRTTRVPRAVPRRASHGPRTGIFNVFHILRGPCVTRKGVVRRPCGHVRELTQP